MLYWFHDEISFDDPFWLDHKKLCFKETLFLADFTKEKSVEKKQSSLLAMQCCVEEIIIIWLSDFDLHSKLQQRRCNKRK